jgi:hypothetical protein
MKIFGREPALWLALLYNAVIFVSAFGVELTGDQQGAINAIGAASVGLLTAAMVEKDGLSAAILGFVKCGLALAIAFGLHMTPENQAVVMGMVSAAVAMFVRTQVTASVQG